MVGATSQDTLIAAARQLMLERGYPSTTVDEICELAGVSKGAFYYHFGSKEELGRVTLDAFYTDLTRAIMDGPYVDVDEPVARFLAFLDHLRDVAQGPLFKDGCLLGSFSHDLASGVDVPGLELAAKFETLRDGLAELVAPALATRPGLGFSADVVAEQMLALLEGGIVLAKAQGSSEPLGRVLTAYRQQMDDLLAG